MENSRIQVSPTPAHGRFESFLYALVVFACLLTLPVIYYEWQGVNSRLLTIADWCIWAIFVVEYGVLLTLARDRKRYVVGNWLNAGIIVLSFPLLPAMMGSVRLVRLTRLVRLFLVTTKGLRTMKVVVSHKEFRLCAERDSVACGGGGSASPHAGAHARRIHGWAVVGGSHHDYRGLWRYHANDCNRPFCRGHADAGGHGSDRHSCGFGVGLFRWSRTN